MILQVLLIILGFILLIKGADILVDGSSTIAKKFHIPEIVIGLTIVSIGTSLPELFVSLTSAMKNYSDISMGNVIGSNICNLLLILGLSSAIKTVRFKRQTRKFEIPFSLIITIIFFIICNIGQNVTRIEGVILILMFLVFIGYTTVMAKKGIAYEKNDKEPDEEMAEKEDKKHLTTVKAIMDIILGIIALKFGGDFVVDNAEKIAHAFNISEKIIGLTIVAIGTSLPELVTSVTAAIKGDSDIAIGNIIGSNIFNMLFIIGITSIISPINYSVSYNNQMYILGIATVLLMIFPYTGKKCRMTRINGFLYLALYVVYMVGLAIA